MRIIYLFTLLLFPFFVSSQVSGTVLDENGEPLPFASVYVRNSTNGTVANAAGEYRLQVERGKQEIVFQYIGYKQQIEQVTVTDKPLRLNVRLSPANLEIGEVVITTEDPAYRIMREVIAKRKYYRNKVDASTYDTYIKGFYKLVDAPKKIFGQDIGNMGGILDTNRTGVVYLSESVSKVYQQASPERKKEIMISSKTSGSENGYSLNRATLTEFNLYDERLEIDREILSPLADNAFNYYQFKWMGTIQDQNGYAIEKIKVIPKRSADPTFSGFLYVVDEWWNLSGVDLFITGNTIKQPVLDTMRIQQEFVPVEKPDTWVLLTQVTSVKFGVLGFKFDGFFNSVFSNYNLHPRFEKGFFDREVFKIEKGANEQDSTYWKSVRPVPLTTEEASDYVKKDSLQRIWKSKEYLDSIDRKNNRFKPFDLLTGYSWQNSYKRTTLSFPGAMQWVQFNTVQGLVFDVNPKFTHYTERSEKYWRVGGNINYGFVEKRLRGALELERKFESIRYSTFSVAGGVNPVQFNDQNPISPVINSSYSLFRKQNFMKLYEKTFVSAEWKQFLLPWLYMRASAEWAQRKWLDNNTDYNWAKRLDDREYTPNYPVQPEPANRLFPDLFALQAEFRFRFGQTYSSYPTFRSYDSSKWPSIYLRYRKAIPVAGNMADFDMIQVQLSENELSWGLAGYSDIRVTAGAFLRNKTLGFMDLYHPRGNQTIFGEPKNYTRSFFMLPYYAYATDKPFVEAHWQHHLQGWLFDKIPGIRKLNLKEVIGANFYYTDRPSADPTYTKSLPYWELNFGLENLGFGPARLFRIDVITGFFGQKYEKVGVMVGMDL
ncbi:MAG: DUF5686 and carboxypeptidase regulatory-like domain-containing protein [Bacteroidetes bacterium]|nr:DUF5686 and carboxypeptidase regulatory-like domain-containing protein [Bacteroidota bacterium]